MEFGHLFHQAESFKETGQKYTFDVCIVSSLLFMKNLSTALEVPNILRADVFAWAPM